MLFESDKEKKLYTVIFIKKEDEILLGMKKRGFGEGKWNGFGGKVEKNETILEGAKRELKEEANIECDDLKEIATIYFEFEIGFEKMMEVHVFTGSSFKGEITESEEMKPKWYKIKEIPYESMWKDDELWFDSMLNDEEFIAHFRFKDYTTIIDYKLIKK
eukprot:gene11619-4861_t